MTNELSHYLLSLFISYRDNMNKCFLTWGSAHHKAGPHLQQREVVPQH